MTSQLIPPPSDSQPHQDSLYEVCFPSHQVSIWHEDFNDSTYIQKSMKETYIAMSQLLNETPNSLLLRNMTFDVQGQKLLLEKCNIDEKCIKSVVCMLINFKEQIRFLSFHNNTHFKDFCLKQFLEYLLDSTGFLRSLSLEKINVSDQAMMKLFDILPQLQQMDVLNLASNQINYFGFEHLTKIVKEFGMGGIKMLNLSNTRLTDRGGIELFEVLIQNSKVEELDLSRNPGLGYKFANSALSIVKGVQQFSLQQIELSYCGISQQAQKQLRDAISLQVQRQFGYQKSTISNLNPVEAEECDDQSQSELIASKLCAQSFDSQDFKALGHQKNQKSQEILGVQEEPQKKTQAPVTINLLDLMRMESQSFDSKRQRSTSHVKNKNLTPQNPENGSFNSNNFSNSPGTSTYKKKKKSRNPSYITKSTAQSSRLKSGKSKGQGPQKKIYVSSVDDQQSDMFQSRLHNMSYQDSSSLNQPQITDTRKVFTLKNSIDDRMFSKLEIQGNKNLRCEEQFQNQNNNSCTNTLQLLDNLKVLNNKPLPKYMPPQGPYKLLNPQPTLRPQNQNLYKRVRENSNRFIPYRQISPNKMPSYQEYYRKQKQKQDKIIQKKIHPNNYQQKCFKKHQAQQEYSRSRQHNRSLAPKIIYNNKIGNAHFKNEKQVKILDLITEQHNHRVDQLSSERYSQKNAYKNYIQSRKIQTSQNTNRKSHEFLNSQSTPQRIYSHVPNSQSNTPNSSVSRLRGNTYRNQFSEHTPKQNSQRKSYSTTKNNSSINTIRFRPQFSNEKGFMSENKQGEMLNPNEQNKGKDVTHIKDMIKSEIERLQFLYQTIDNVMVQQQNINQNQDDRSQQSQSQIF